MFKHYRMGGAALLTMLSMASAFADDPAAPTNTARPSILTLSGFGTVGVVQTNTDDGIFTTGQQKHGATKTADFGPDTKAGAQLDARFNEDFSATVQVFSKQTAKGNYSPDIEWAFGKLKIGNGFDLRVGRIGAPFFMTSDFRNVGYTNVSVRTPTDVYGLVPVRSFDGADILYSSNFGNTTLSGQLWGGRSSVLTGANAQGDEVIWLHNVAGLNFTVENGPFTLHLGSMKTRLGTDGTGLAGFNMLLGGLNQFSAAPGLSSLATISNDLSINNKFASFTGLGAIFDSGNWIISGELVKRITASTYIPTTTAWYTTLGYRVDKFTPYLSFSGRHIISITSVAPVPVSPLLPPIVQGTVPALIGGVNGLLTNTQENTSAIGVRWDAGKNYDIKAEIQQLRFPSGATGIMTQVVGMPPVRNTNVVSLCLDFVF